MHFPCFLTHSVGVASPPRIGVTVWLEVLLQFLNRIPSVGCVVSVYQLFRFGIGNHEHKRTRRLVCIGICCVVCSYAYLRLHSVFQQIRSYRHFQDRYTSNPHIHQGGFGRGVHFLSARGVSCRRVCLRPTASCRPCFSRGGLVLWYRHRIVSKSLFSASVVFMSQRTYSFTESYSVGVFRLSTVFIRTSTVCITGSGLENLALGAGAM